MDARDFVGECLAVATRCAAPRGDMTVSQWADQHREITAKQGGERGRWRTSRTPYLREIMDCLSPQSRVHDVVVMKSSQVGVSEACVNWLGFCMTEAPSPTMVMMPTLEMRDAWKVQKLNPMFTDTAVVRDLMGGVRSRDATHRADVIDFPGGVLFLAGGNSPNSYAQRSVANLILDDLDRFPIEIGEEGDVVTLAKGRTKAFARPKRLFISTPTVKAASSIEVLWLESDQRRYNVPCPHCGHYQPLEWGGADRPYGLKWSDREAWYVCCDCGVEIGEHYKPTMLAEGRWIPTYPERKMRGYHLTALLAPLGLGPAWADLALDWVSAKGNPAKLRAFVNTQLGETWEEGGDSVSPVGLLARVETYAEGREILARTAGVDVQKDRIEVSIVEWGASEEAWLIDHEILPGDTAQPEVWTHLGELLARWSPDAAAVDAGYNTGMVHRFVEARRWAFAVLGKSGHRPIVEPERVRRQRLRRQKKKGVSNELVGDDEAKALIAARLKLLSPGPGYIHFPAEPAFDDEYFAQLTAEKLVTRLRGTRPVHEWVQTRPRNETLDCLKYALAALRLLPAGYRRVSQRDAAGPAPARAAAPPAPAVRHAALMDRLRGRRS